MHEWSEFLDKLALLLGSASGLITALVALGKTIFGKSRTNNDAKEKVKDSKETELYKHLLFDNEKKNEELEDENQRLKKKVKQLQKQINKLKENIKRLKQ